MKISGNYQQVPHEIFDLGLTPNQAFVWLALHKFAPNGKLPAQVWPSIPTVCRLINVSRATVHRAINRLVELDLLEIQYSLGWYSNRYTLKPLNTPQKPSHDETVLNRLTEIPSHRNTVSLCDKTVSHRDPNYKRNYKIKSSPKGDTSVRPDRAFMGAFVKAGMPYPQTKKGLGPWFDAIKNLRNADPPVVADMIEDLVMAYKGMWPRVECTPTAIAKNLHLVRNWMGDHPKVDNSEPSIRQVLLCPLCGEEVIDCKCFAENKRAWRTAVDEHDSNMGYNVSEQEYEDIVKIGDPYAWLESLQEANVF